ncbi:MULTISPECIES: ImuA family protein [unclassified Sphingobium]|uniref:ImuA family protein n=1 Tax=unclassified Sphingobium TaxID=2611147 RepID=UPI0007705356|nr:MULTISPECIES: hypothetical protein [unclassified Sphingobium]AMK24217.1 hypothetical protein K426_16425 [Sphingobium sp. TKS]NML90294.1 hypothetical protein [Sphingobium sp. TB-6]
MVESVKSLAALRRHIASLEGVPASQPHARVETGHAAIDQALDGGLARGRVHEFFAAVEEAAAGAGLALILARLAAGDAPLLWLRTAAAGRAGGMPYGPGLAALGVDPERLVIGVMADDGMLLRAAVDALRCPALGGLVVELHGSAPLLDLTASRRLALAAEASGVTAFMLRVGGDPVPSAADTRWRVAAAPSLPVPGNGPGMCAFDLSLLRRRAGRDGLGWRLVWDNGRGMFEESGGGRDERHDLGQSGREQDGRRQDGGGRDRQAPLSGAVVSVPAGRPAADRAA